MVQEMRIAFPIIFNGLNSVFPFVELIGECFSNDGYFWAFIAQGLRPISFRTIFGTTKVVPCYKAGL
jgi:hypothetical protein